MNRKNLNEIIPRFIVIIWFSKINLIQSHLLNTYTEINVTNWILKITYSILPKSIDKSTTDSNKPSLNKFNEYPMT